MLTEIFIEHFAQVSCTNKSRRISNKSIKVMKADRVAYNKTPISIEVLMIS